MTKSCQESIDVMSGSNWCFVCWSQWLCITRSLAVLICQSTSVSHSKRVYLTVWLKTIPPLWHNRYTIVDWLRGYFGSWLNSCIVGTQFDKPTISIQNRRLEWRVFSQCYYLNQSFSFSNLSNTFNPLDPLGSLDPCIKSEHLNIYHKPLQPVLHIGSIKMLNKLEPAID